MWVVPGGSLGGPGAEMSHSFDKVYYVVVGRATFHSEGEATEIQPGDVVTVPAGVAHHVQNDPDAVLQIFWCLGTEWGGTEADEFAAYTEVDSASGWHVVG
jgi:mannose-6-phosphate isomerase-like protein (cupin superfamily)